jgi:DNA-directed RNA polymerase subunit RPC12/RpoP
MTSDPANPEVPYTGPVPDHLRTMIETADGLIKTGSTVHFKWSCMGCGARQTFEEANKLYKTGRCEECGHVTDLFSAEARVNYLVIAVLGGSR